jgi:hypothetical protein
MPNTEQNEPTEQPMDLATALRIEREKMTRRAALRKLGFGAGLAVFSLLGVDDLARLVGQRMERMAGDNKVAEQIAKEFQQAGIAFAMGPSGVCLGASDCSTCQNNIRTSCNKACVQNYTFPGLCELAVSNCASNCAGTVCPGSDNSVSEMLALEQCYDSCISNAGYPVAAYPC